MDPNIDINQINQIVAATFEVIGLEYTIDNRVEVLAGLAKNVAAMEELNPLTRIRISLEITVEIIRLRTEKQIFGL